MMNSSGDSQFWAFHHDGRYVLFRLRAPGSWVEARVFFPGHLFEKDLPENVIKYNPNYFEKTWYPSSPNFEDSRDFWRKCCRYYGKPPEVLTEDEYDNLRNELEKKVANA